MAIVVNAFLTLTLSEIRAARAGDVISPDDMDLALAVFNEYLDALNIEKRGLYTRAFTTFTLTPSLQPHTIGVAANAPTLTVTIGRPTEVKRANIILTGNIRSRLDLLDDDAWNAIKAGAAAGQAVTITAAIPSKLYYDTSWPNGSIYLWPVPSAAYGLELELWTQLAQVALTDTLDLPPGYQQALRLTLAELLAPAFGQQVSPETSRQAREARARVWGNNDVVPDLQTRDAGVPGGRGGTYDYRTGMVS